MNILVPLIALLMSLLVGIIPTNEAGLLAHLRTPWLVFIFAPLFGALYYLIRVIMPGVQHAPGRSPKESFNPAFLIEESGKESGPPHVALMLDLLEHLQDEITFSNDVNEKRIKYLKYAQYVTLTWLMLMLILLFVYRW